MKVLNLPALAKKGSMSQSAKPKSTKRRDDSFETCLDIVPYEGSLPLIGIIVLEGFPPPFAHSRSNRRSTACKPKPSAPKSFMDAPPSSKTHGSKRKTSPPTPYTTTERRVCYL